MHPYTKYLLTDAYFIENRENFDFFSSNARLFLRSIFLISLSLGIYEVIFNLYILKLRFREDFLGLMLSLVSIATGFFQFQHQ